MKSIVVFFIIFSGYILQASPSSWEIFHRNLELTEMNFLHETPDGGFAAGGLRRFDYWLLRLDGAGRVLWEKAIGSESFESRYYAALKDGGYLLAGWDDNGTIDIHLMKVSSEGQVIWQNVFGMKTTLSYPLAITGTRDNGAAVVGFNPSGAFGGKGRMLFLKISPAGRIQIQKSYDVYTPTSIEQLPDGGFIVATWNFTVLRLNASGNVLWQRNIDVKPFLYEQNIKAVQATDSGFFLAGTIGDLDTPTEILVVKLDDGGNVLWQKTYGGSRDDNMIALKSTSDGGFVIGASTTSFKPSGVLQALILKADSQGDLLWQKTILDRNGTFGVGDIVVTSDGGYGIGGKVDAGLAIVRLTDTGEVTTSCQNLSRNTNIVPKNSKATSFTRNPNSTPIHLLSRREFAPTVLLLDEVTTSLCDPVIELPPFPVAPGYSIGIVGRSFGYQQGKSKVLLGGMDLGIADRWTQRDILIRIPENAVTSPLLVQVGQRISNVVEAVIAPNPPDTILPDSGPSAGGTRVAISIPYRFSQSQFQIKFGNSFATDGREVPSGGLVVCTSPQGVGIVEVTITNGQETVLLGRFSYL